MGRAYSAAKRYELAIKYYELATDQGNALAMHNLGVFYNSGLGTAKNINKAAELYKKAAEQGFGLSQIMLGNMYSEGIGLDRSYTEAFKWYSKAAAQGFPKAQYATAIRYYWGIGTEKDFAKAAELFERALKQGDEETMPLLKMYMQHDRASFDQLLANNAELAARFGSEPKVTRLDAAQEKTVTASNQTAASPANTASSTAGLDTAPDDQTWQECRSNVYSKPSRASILAKTPPVPNNLTILQLADGTKISPQQTALISALENDVQECDKALSKSLAAKAPGISVAFEGMLSKDQDSWVELVQKKISWGDLNQKRKQHYLDYQAQKKVEIDKAQALERQRVADQEARKQAREKLAQQAKQAEDARVAQQQREEQMREQRREACLNQVTKNTVSGIFDLAGGGGGDLDLFGGAIMQGLQAGAAEAQCNRQ